MVVVAGDTYTNNDYFEGEEETQQALDYMVDFNHIKLWTSDGSFTGFVDVFKAMLTGCGFIYFAGHHKVQKLSSKLLEWECRFGRI